MSIKKSILLFISFALTTSIFSQTKRVGIGTETPTRQLHLEGDPTSDDNIIYSRVNFIGTSDVRGIETYSITNPGWGLGAHFTGGYRGALARNDGQGFTGTSIGLEAESVGTAGTRIGLFAEASGGTTNLAARFGSGNVEVQNGLRIGTTGQSGRVNINNTNTLWGSWATALRVNSSNSGNEVTYGGLMTVTKSGIGDVFGMRVTTSHTGATGFAYGLHSEVPSADGWSAYFVGKNHMSDDLRIGTTADPYNGAYRLIVDGKIISEEVRIQNSSAWPDYVFASDYKLMPLSDLEKSINKNHHLPNIPPASEVDREGIQVGDMQVRMMEKIEELTLYIIQLEKRIAQIEKK